MPKKRSDYKPTPDFWDKFHGRWRPNTSGPTGTWADYIIKETKKPDFWLTVIFAIVATAMLTILFIPPKAEEVIIEVPIIEEVEEVEEIEEVEETKTLIMHTGFQPFDYRQVFVRYAYEVGGLDLVKLIDCECGKWRLDCEADGAEESFGLCQFNLPHQRDIVLDERFLVDHKFQIDNCKRLLDNGTPFYGPDRIIKKTGKKCFDHVEDRFIFVETSGH